MPLTTSNCDRDRLRQLLDGSLPEAAAGETVQHLETCASCRAQMESFAAPENWWTDLRETFSGIPADQESYLRDPFDSQADDTGTASTPLTFLAASDNPAMLGRLGEFEILEEIGCGGMGIVLKGYDRELNRYVAVKVLHPVCAAGAAARRRFVREAQAAAAIVHQHVVAIHAVDPNHQPPYLVMPFIPGESLQQRLNRLGSFDLLDALRIGQQVAEGLAAAHAHGLVHRDIKPGNILLERNVERVLLTDFGLARAADDASLTRSGVIAGTPQYMSPEQARGDQVDHRTDLFSLGSVLYTMFAGHSPFRAESAMGVLRRVCDESPRPLREVNPTVPEWMEAFIAKLHMKQPEDRFDSAAIVAHWLQQALAHVQQPTIVPLPNEMADLVAQTKRSGQKAKIAAMGLAVIVSIIGLFLTFATPLDRTVVNEATKPALNIDQEIEPIWDDNLQPETEQIQSSVSRWESDSEF